MIYFYFTQDLHISKEYLQRIFHLVIYAKINIGRRNAWFTLVRRLNLLNYEFHIFLDYF